MSLDRGRLRSAANGFARKLRIRPRRLVSLVIAGVVVLFALPWLGRFWWFGVSSGGCASRDPAPFNTADQLVRSYTDFDLDLYDCDFCAWNDCMGPRDNWICHSDDGLALIQATVEPEGYGEVELEDESFDPWIRITGGRPSRFAEIPVRGRLWVKHTKHQDSWVWAGAGQIAYGYRSRD